MVHGGECALATGRAKSAIAIDKIKSISVAAIVLLLSIKLFSIIYKASFLRETLPNAHYSKDEHKKCLGKSILTTNFQFGFFDTFRDYLLSSSQRSN